MSAREGKEKAMSRSIRLAAVSALGLAPLAFALAGCSAQPHVQTAANNYSLYSMHQPVVEHNNFIFDVAADGNGVAAGEQLRLAAWFDSIGLAYGDHITLDDGRGSASVEARRDVAKVAAEHGLLVSEDGAPVTGQVPAGAIRIVASRATAHVNGCPEWSNPDIESPVRTSSNYGCSVNANLAAMIANPDDLVHGRESSGSGAAFTAGRAVRTYRESQSTARQGLQQTSTTQGR
jgi:pilus assembly protein CpaD